MLTVTITVGRDTMHTSRHRTDNRDEAITRAVRRAYGRSAHWQDDHDRNQCGPQSTRWGQVFRPVRGDDSYLTSVTGRVVATVSDLED